MARGVFEGLTVDVGSGVFDGVGVLDGVLVGVKVGAQACRA